MVTLSTHINFNGNAEEAFTFYKSVLGGEFTAITRFKDMAGPGFEVPPEEADKLMHITLTTGAHMLMGNDVPSFMGKTNEHENRSKIYVTAESHEEASRIYKGLSAGGTVEVPIEDGSEGPCYAMFRDKYGIEWIINFTPKA